MIEVSNTKQISNFSLPKDLPLPGLERKIRTFLISKSKSKSDKIDFFVCSIISFASLPNEDDLFNFFDLSHFNGVIIYSDMQGNYKSAKLYTLGQIFNLGPKNQNNAQDAIFEFNLYIGSSNLTKSDKNSEDNVWNRELQSITVVATRNNPIPITPDYWSGYYPQITDCSQIILEPGGGGSDEGVEENDYKDYLKINFNLTTREGGKISGSGVYTWGEMVSVTATPTVGCKFIMWTGDLKEYGDSQGFQIMALKNINSEAIFHKLLPCLSPNESNPLLEMEILPTKNNGVKGGRLGHGRGRFHNGVDLSASVGSPIYAMFDGDVVSAISRYDQSTPWKRYEKTYGSQDAAGNRVTIASKVDGNDIVFLFMHLAEVRVKRNDKVKAGDIIGTVGTTGNASDPDCAGPHLHLTTYDKKAHNKSKRDEGDYYNPEIFLYTKFDNQGKATRLCIEKK